MIADCFLPQTASVGIIENVASFCSECYTDIVRDELIYYDMKNCHYICQSCQEKIQENLDMDCEPINIEENSLF
jgi:hypothetical protein